MNNLSNRAHCSGGADAVEELQQLRAAVADMRVQLAELQSERRGQQLVRLAPPPTTAAAGC